MKTYELTLDDSPKAQLLLELLAGMDVVKRLKRKDFSEFTHEGKPMDADDLQEMVAVAEEDIKQGNTFSSGQVRKMLAK